MTVIYKSVLIAIFTLWSLSVLGQESESDLNYGQKGFRAGLTLGMGSFEINRLSDQRELRILTPYQYSLTGAISFMYDFPIFSSHISIGPRVDIQGSFKRLKAEYSHPRDEINITAESRVYSMQGTIYPILIKVGLRKIKLHGGIGMFKGKILNYEFLLSETLNEESLGEFHNKDELGVSFVGGIDTGVVIIEAFADYNTNEIFEGYKQQFVGLRFVFTQ